MVAVKRIAPMMMGLMLATLAGCATTHGHLTGSADRLEHDADAFASDTRTEDRSEYRNEDFSRDARDLADRAHEFRRAVDDRRADDRDVTDAFDRVSRSYHALRDDVERSGSLEARTDLRPVTQDYLDIESEMGTNPARDRVAEEHDRRDRY